MSTPSIIRRVAAGAYVAAACVLVFGAGAGDDPVGWLFLLFLLAVVVAPALLGLWAAQFVSVSPIYHLYCVGAVGICISGYTFQWHVLYVGPPDALNGLVLLIAPIYQCAAIAVAFILAKLLIRYVFKS